MEKGLIFTYLLTYGGAFFSLFRPFVGLMIFFAFGIITPEAMWYWAVPRGHYSRTVALALLTGWAWKKFGSWKFYDAAPMVYSIIMFWVWALISSQQSEFPDRAWGFITPFTKILLPILVGVTMIKTVKELKILAWTLALSQGYIAYEFNLSYFIDHFNRAISDDGYARMDNNSLCIAMVTGCGLCFFLALRDTVTWRKWMMFAVAAMLAHVPMFGESRGAMLSLVITGVATFLLIPREPKHYAIFLLATVVALDMAGPAVVERFATIFVEGNQRDKSSQSRLDLWAGCVTIMGEYPIFGLGADCFPLVVPEYTDHKYKRGKEAHSVWFQTGAELGFPGLFFLANWYGLTCWKLWKLKDRRDLIDPWLADSARMVIAALVAFGVSASFVSLEGLELPYYVCLLGVCTIKVASTPQFRPQSRLSRAIEQAGSAPPQYQESV
jgi:probable O-glycosylation ligase (exosortase A-associated)